jgi:hypothetical protein
MERDLTADEMILTFTMKEIIGRDCLKYPKIKRVVSSLDRADGCEGCNN